MILLIHGTGDDDEKAENWIPWVAKLMERYGELCLAIPGVASSEQDTLSVHAQGFLAKLVGPKAGHATVQSNNAGLMTALNRGGDELKMALNVMNGSEEDFILALVQGKRKEKGWKTSGIKIRVAVASLCAVAYYRRRPVAQQRPIRIIGHSRGGCVAVGVHNVLTSYGIPCDRTLTLDPCHGVDKRVIGGAVGTLVPVLGNLVGAGIGAANIEDYYHKIWGGSLINIPCDKGVGSDWAGFAVYRPLIEAAAGGNAHVTNLPKLMDIKHGHMGKIRALPGNEAAKNTERARLTRLMDGVVTLPFPDARTALRRFFRQFVKLGTGDYLDRMTIVGQVISTLTR
jgi:hypothetical protein